MPRLKLSLIINPRGELAYTGRSMDTQTSSLARPTVTSPGELNITYGGSKNSTSTITGQRAVTSVVNLEQFKGSRDRKELCSAKTFYSSTGGDYGNGADTVGRTNGKALTRETSATTKLHIFLPSSLSMSSLTSNDETETFRSAVTCLGSAEEKRHTSLSKQASRKSNNAKGYVSRNGKTSPGFANHQIMDPGKIKMESNCNGYTQEEGGEVAPPTPTSFSLIPAKFQTENCAIVSHNEASVSDLILLRDLSLRVGPKWKDVASGLGFKPEDVASLVKANPMSKGSELAYRTLAIWWRKREAFDAKPTLQKVFRENKLLAAEAVLMNRHQSQRPATAVTIGDPASSTPVPSTKGDKMRARITPKTNLQRYLTNSGRPKTSIVRTKAIGGEGTRLVLSNTPDAAESPLVGPLVPVRGISEGDPHNLYVTNTVLKRPRTSLATMNQSYPISDESNAELPIHLSVYGLVAQDPRRAILRFYTTILRDEERHISLLSKHPAFSAVSVKRFTLDSFAMYVKCKSQSAVSDLETLHRSHRLGMFLTDVLAPPEVLAEVGVKGLRLEATLKRPEVEYYRKTIKGSEQKAPFPKNTERSICAWNNGDKTSRILHDIDKKLRSEVNALSSRYQLLEHELSDFLMAIKMSKCVDPENITCLNDIIRTFTYLRDSPSIGKYVRTDLVREYLAIVNLIRITCDEIQRGLTVDDGTSRDEEISYKISEIEKMLDPNFDFTKTEHDIHVQLTATERKYFRGLLCFVPSVLKMFIDICDQIQLYLEDLGKKEFNNNKIVTKRYKVRFPSVLQIE